MRRHLLASILVAAALLLSGCARDEPPNRYLMTVIMGVGDPATARPWKLVVQSDRSLGYMKRWLHREGRLVGSSPIYRDESGRNAIRPWYSQDERCGCSVIAGEESVLDLVALPPATTPAKPPGAPSRAASPPPPPAAPSAGPTTGSRIYAVRVVVGVDDPERATECPLQVQSEESLDELRARIHRDGYLTLWSPMYRASDGRFAVATLANPGVRRGCVIVAGEKAIVDIRPLGAARPSETAPRQ